ncbi:aldehyde dehydrogenase family protein [Halorarum salinum]|uniref:Aldehyde dehydrogenase family protein n=1 Tax=Halorarum salinum TaxID=2743089 RepID=A0A7D5QF21_9EURY|nr:aldehyde dehydrogenase family protein [Halobaculum salinum]QLG60324.1 aldehyde dehydrogenase family protein [Halobaculum salinum]
MGSGGLMNRFDREWRLFVNGSFVESTGSAVLPVHNPATGAAFTETPDSTATDIDRAVAAADEAAEDLAAMTPRGRGDLLHDLANVIKSHAEELAHLVVAENGKPIRQARSDVESAVERVRYYVGGTDKFLGDAVLDSTEEVQKKIFEPLGVVGIVIPWNWSLVNSVDFAAIAIAAGNAAVVKPAPETPLSALRAAELLGNRLPDGALNVVTGRDETGKALVEHPDVDKVAFVGNDETGERILRSLADTVTPAMMELGGKNAAVVFPNVDVSRAADGVIYSSFKNNGEDCSGSERLLVHEDIYDEFVTIIRKRVESVTVGEGTDEGCQIGPLISQAHRDHVAEKVERALDQGASVLVQADLPYEPGLQDGFWFPRRCWATLSATTTLCTRRCSGRCWP